MGGYVIKLFLCTEANIKSLPIKIQSVVYNIFFVNSYTTIYTNSKNRIYNKNIKRTLVCLIQYSMKTKVRDNLCKNSKNLKISKSRESIPTYRTVWSKVKVMRISFPGARLSYIERKLINLNCFKSWMKRKWILLKLLRDLQARKLLHQSLARWSHSMKHSMKLMKNGRKIHNLRSSFEFLLLERQRKISFSSSAANFSFTWNKEVINWARKNLKLLSLAIDLRT